MDYRKSGVDSSNTWDAGAHSGNRGMQGWIQDSGIQRRWGGKWIQGIQEYRGGCREHTSRSVLREYRDVGWI